MVKCVFHVLCSAPGSNGQIGKIKQHPKDDDLPAYPPKSTYWGFFKALDFDSVEGQEVRGFVAMILDSDSLIGHGHLC
jgi:hypothetical protein